MKKIILFSIIALFIIACGSDKKGLSSKKAQAVASIDGAKIYKAYCVICHGTKGDMGSNGAFNLTNSILNVDARMSVIKKGRGVMTPFESILNEEEIKAVAEYTMTLTIKK